MPERISLDEHINASYNVSKDTAEDLRLYEKVKTKAIDEFAEKMKTL